MGEELEKELEKVIGALNGADAEWLSEHYVSEVTRFHQRGAIDVGWDEEKAADLQRTFAAGVRFNFTEVELIDLRIYGDTGITAGHFISELTLPDGTRTGGPARFTYVWTRTSDGWKEVHHHISDLREWGQ
jgi:ketosteroid isomerase-like protein